MLAARHNNDRSCRSFGLTTTTTYVIENCSTIARGGNPTTTTPSHKTSTEINEQASNRLFVGLRFFFFFLLLPPAWLLRRPVRALHHQSVSGCACACWCLINTVRVRFLSRPRSQPTKQRATNQPSEQVSKHASKHATDQPTNSNSPTNQPTRQPSIVPHAVSMHV